MDHKEEKIPNVEYKRIVFCDFDRTITKIETFEGMFKHLEYTKGFAQNILDQIHKKDITIKAGVRKLLGKIPSSKYNEVIEYAGQQEIREDFVNFIEFLEKKDVPLIIISGGLMDMVKVILGDLFKRIHKVFAVEIDRSGEYIRVCADFEGRSELVSKIKVMDLYNYKDSIFIGDGLTDEAAAKSDKNSIVFARDDLAEILQTDCAPFEAWESFTDICAKLKGHWK